MRKQVPPHLTKDVVEFSTMKPIDRFESIKKGLQVKNQTIYPSLMFVLITYQVLSYGQSEYVRQFGMNVNDKMVEVTARVLDPPTLKYGPGSKHVTIVWVISSLYGLRIDSSLPETCQRTLEHVSALFYDKFIISPNKR